MVKRMRIGVIALTSAAILGTGGASAFAASPASPTLGADATPTTLSGIQAKAAAAITLRVNDLNAAIAKVNAAKNLGTDAASLDHYLGVDIAPLQTLGQKIAADTTITTAQSDYEDIFVDYRVFALVLPAARLAGASDTIDNGSVPTLTADSAKAAQHVNSVTQGTLDPLISDLNSEISGASTSTTGVASTVMGYVPSQWNADHQLLSAPKASLNTAVSDVKKGRSDVQQIRAYLKASHAAVPATTPTSSS